MVAIYYACLKSLYKNGGNGQVMDFNEKLQMLRKQKNLTQEELAEALYVSRTAISKWESGRGYPNIDSLKAISKFFSVSIDELLSGEELIDIAQNDNRGKMQNLRDLVFGMLDCLVSMFLFLPFFAEYGNKVINRADLISLTGVEWYTKMAYILITLLIIIFGILTLALQNCHSRVWVKNKSIISLILSVIGVLIFMVSLQPYPAFAVFMLLIIKGVLLLKRP